MEGLFGDFLTGMFEGPVAQRGDTGCEQYRRVLRGFTREVDHVAHAGDVGLEGLETEVEVNLPLVVCHRRRLVRVCRGKGGEGLT